MNFQNSVGITHDPNTNAVSTTDHTLTTLHEGYNFNTFIYNPGLSTGGTDTLCFSTGTSGSHIHIIPTIEASGDGYFEIIEDCFWNSSTGTSILVFNHNRNKTQLPSVLNDISGVFVRDGNILRNPTGITGGTTIEHLMTSSGKHTGGANSTLDEWMLKDGAKYCLKYTSESNSNKMCIRIGWYEHI